MEMFYVLLFFNFLNAYVIFDFMDKMYERKYSRQRVYFFAYFLFVALHVSVNMLRIVPLNVVYEILCINIFSYVLYHKINRKYLYNLLFVMYLMALDELSIIIYSIIKAQTLFESFANMGDVFCIGLFNFFVVFITYHLMILYVKKSYVDEVSKKQRVLFVVFLLWEICIIIYFAKSQIEYFSIVSMLFVLSFICVDLYIIYLFEFVAKNYRLKNEVNLSQQQANMLTNNINDIENKYNQSRKIIHETRSYVHMLNQLYENNEILLAEKYAMQINEKLSELEYRFHSKNRILNLLINDKLILAKHKNIKVNLKIEDIKWDNIKEIDLTTLFFNLLNNAFEACESIDKGCFINIRILEINKVAVIKILNTCNKSEINWKNGKLLSTKEGHAGIGLSNIYSIVNNYHGDVKIEVDDRVFVVKIILPL